MGRVVIINIKHGPAVQRWLVTSRLVKFASLHLAGSTNKLSGLWYEDSEGYCSPVTQAPVWYVPSCWPLSEQCQVKFLSWPVLRSHSISSTNSTTVTLLWWAAGTQKQDLGSISVLKLLRNAALTLHRRKLLVQDRIIRSTPWNCHVSNADANYCGHWLRQMPNVIWVTNFKYKL